MVNATGEPVHFAYPFRRGADGKLATVVQGSPDHTSTQVNVVVRYPKGSRRLRPEFGVTYPEFESGALIEGAALIVSEVEEQVDHSDLTYDEFMDEAYTAVRHIVLEVGHHE